MTLTGNSGQTHISKRCEISQKQNTLQRNGISTGIESLHLPNAGEMHHKWFKQHPFVVKKSLQNQTKKAPIILQQPQR